MNPIGFNCHGWADELYNNWTFSRESSFCSAAPLKPPSHPSGERGSDGGEGRRTWVAESQKLLRRELRCSSRGQLPEKAAPVQTKSPSQHASVACRGTSHSLPVGTEEHQPAVMQSTSASHCHALFCEVVHGACYTLGIPYFRKRKSTCKDAIIGIEFRKYIFQWRATYIEKMMRCTFKTVTSFIGIRDNILMLDEKENMKVSKIPFCQSQERTFYKWGGKLLLTCHDKKANTSKKRDWT